MLIQEVSIEAVYNKLVTLIADNQAGLMLLAGENIKFNLNDLISILKEKEIDFFGALFPKVIYDSESYDDALIAIPLNFGQSPQIIKGLDTGNIEIKNIAQDKHSGLSYITFVDGLSTQIAKYLTILYDELGSGNHVIGGGAGSLTFQQKPCVFSREGCFQDAAVLVGVRSNCNIGAGHGWTDLQGPFVATQTKSNIIEELNWQPAIEVYKSVVEMDAGKQISVENFSKIAQSYPFGIHKDGAEKIVRDPIAFTEEGGLICVGEVPENSVLFLLKGREETLIKAARKATSLSLDIDKADVKEVFVVDCISRTLFLGDHYKEELNGIKKEVSNQVNVIKGVLSLGEIASSGKGYLEFYNKTLVVGVFYNKAA